MTSEVCASPSCGAPRPPKPTRGPRPKFCCRTCWKRDRPKSAKEIASRKAADQRRGVRRRAAHVAALDSCVKGCRRCGAEFSPVTSFGKSSYCSDKCRDGLVGPDCEFKPCVKCGSSVPPKTKGPRADFCSSACQRSTWSKTPNGRLKIDKENAKVREASALLRASLTYTCPVCSLTFTPSVSVAQTYCSTLCERRYYAKPDPSLQCATADCERSVLYKKAGLCSACYKVQRRAEFGREPTKTYWTDARRDAYHKRRAQKAATEVADEPVLRDEIAVRDGFMCGICSELVDMSVAWPLTDSPSIDHIVPLAAGGAHSPENCQLAHLGCNIRKGARVLDAVAS